MKKSIILLLFIVNIAFGQSVTISPTDASHLNISKFEGTAKLSLVGLTNGTNINGHSEISMFNNSFIGSSATSTIKFNNIFSIKHTYTPNPPFDVNTLGIFYNSTPFLLLNPSTTKLETVPIGVSHSSANLLNLTNTTALANGVSNEMYFKTGSYFTGAIKTIGTGTTFARMGLFTYTDVSASNLIERISILDGGNVGIGVTAPQTKLHVDGNIRSSTLAGSGNRKVYANSSGNLITATSTEYQSFGKADFRTPVNVNQALLVTDGIYYMASGSSPIEFPIHLPHNALITNVKVYYTDNSNTNNLSFTLLSNQIDSNFATINNTSSSGTTLGILSLNITPNLTVDNQNYHYYFHAQPTSSWLNNSTLGLMSVVITYTTD
jgi:hypothetical protein